MFIRIHKSYRYVVAICDEDLIGKKFEEGKFQLDVKESFYKDPESDKNLSEEEVKKIIQDMQREDATFNIVGEKSIKTSLETGIIEEEGVGRISGIPFALVLD